MKVAPPNGRVPGFPNFYSSLCVFFQTFEPMGPPTSKICPDIFFLFFICDQNDYTIKQVYGTTPGELDVDHPVLITAGSHGACLGDRGSAMGAA